MKLSSLSKRLLYNKCRGDGDHKCMTYPSFLINKPKVFKIRTPSHNHRLSVPLVFSVPQKERFPFLFIFLIMSSLFPWATSSLEPLASFALSKNVSLHILGGSVVDYAPGAFRRTVKQEENKQEETKPPRLAAIVNAANEECLGGGGVDGAISAAGGLNLDKDRRALPLLPNPAGGPRVRCPTGSAVVTGPGDYGRLNVPFVIHAVGPIYHRWTAFSVNGEEEEEEPYPFAEPDALLKSAYTSSLDVANENNIEEVAFALLSAGVYRGEQTLENVLSLAVQGIRDFVKKNKGEPIVQDISLVAFSVRERQVLLEVSKYYVGESDPKDRIAGEGDKEL